MWLLLYVAYQALERPLRGFHYDDPAHGELLDEFDAEATGRDIPQEGR